MKYLSILRADKSDKQFCFVFFLAACLGITVAWFTPPFAIPDEGAHYLRSYEVSRGHLINSRGNIGIPIPCREYLVIAKQYAPVAFYQDIAEKMQPNAEECLVSSVNTAGAYSPVPYIAGALGIRMAEYLGLSVETRLKLGRSVNAVITSIICLLSILFVRRYRYLLAILVLLPMCIWLRASLSADAMTISVSILYLAYILRLHEREVLITRGIIMFLVFLAVLLGSMKPVYGLLGFSSLILVKYSSEYRLKLSEMLALAVPGIAAFLVGSMWVISAAPSLVYINKFGGADPELQLNYILNDPVNFAGIIYNTLLNNSALFFVQALLPTIDVGAWIPQQDRLFIASVFFMFLLFTMLTTPALLRIWQRIVLLGITSLVLIIMLIPSYLTYTLVGFNEILGLQGRYFLPLIFYAIIAGGIAKPMCFFASDTLRIIIAVVMPLLISTSFLIRYLV